MSSILEIKEIANQCIGIIEEYSDVIKFKNDYKNSIRSNVNELLDCDKPRLMVCGVYSAGKSTLVNILCRKEVAEMGAEPKTDKVTEYKNESKDYILVDSPGVDAPIEHEKITDDFVKKCSALMFVVSTKNAESEANYRKINEWMKYEKPLFIVLNDKSGNVNLEREETIYIREKIEENLRKSGYDVNKKYNVVTVNAKMGLQSLSLSDEVKKKKLLEASNILELESLINSTMKEGYALFLAPIGELQRILDSMELELMELETGNDDKELFNQLAMIEKEGLKINESLKRQVKMSCDNGKEEIIQACMSPNSQSEINKITEQIAQNIATSVDDNFKNKISNLSQVVNTGLSSYGIEMNNTGLIFIDGEQYDFNDIILGTLDSIDQGNVIKSVIGGAAAGGAALTALTTLTVGEGAIATMLGGLPLGPIGMIGGAIVGLIFSNSKRKKMEAAEKKRIAEENRRRREAYDAHYKKLQTEIGAKMEIVENEYSKRATELVSLAISNLKDIINKKIADNKRYDERVSEARLRVASLKAEVEGLKNYIQ